jgi:hypothetical protein
LSCATEAPFSAARVAAILGQPWAERLWSPACYARFLKGVAKGLFRQWFTALAADEREITSWASVERAL